MEMKLRKQVGTQLENLDFEIAQMYVCTFERTGEEKNVFGDGDDFRADSVAGKESDGVGAFRRGGGGTSEGSWSGEGGGDR